MISDSSQPGMIVIIFHWVSLINVHEMLTANNYVLEYIYVCLGVVLGFTDGFEDGETAAGR